MEKIGYENAELILVSKNIKPGKVSWRSPSNIALVKYWGKRSGQIPENPSISFTLSTCFTETTIAFLPRTDFVEKISMSFTFEGIPNHVFGNRVKKYLNDLLPIFPFMNQLHLDIYTRNSFPHSSGIASSASAYSALSLCLCSMEKRLFDGKELDRDLEFLKKASYVARLGSGSASRSIFPMAALWGAYHVIKDSSNEYAIPLGDQIHTVFQTFRDTILLVQNEEKKVSSSDGHALMETHPFAMQRYQQAKNNALEMVKILQTGDLERFGIIVENEALTLHSLMMSSAQGYFLMAPNTLRILQLVREFRKTTSFPVFFSLDAGPNVHLLYPLEYIDKVEPFIQDVLLPYCEEEKQLTDYVGKGPVQII